MKSSLSTSKKFYFLKKKKKKRSLCYNINVYYFSKDIKSFLNRYLKQKDRTMIFKHLFKVKFIICFIKPNTVCPVLKISTVYFRNKMLFVPFALMEQKQEYVKCWHLIMNIQGSGTKWYW